MSRLLNASTRKQLAYSRIIYSPVIGQVLKNVTGTLLTAILEILHEDESESAEYRQKTQ